MRNIYLVRKRGEKVLEGKAEDVCAYLECNPSVIYIYSKSHKKYKRKYTIDLVGQVEEKPKKKIKVEKEKPMSKMEYLEYHLKTMGITNFNDNPSKYIPSLKKKGLNVKYHKSIYDNKSYIVEVVNAN